MNGNQTNSKDSKTVKVQDELLDLLLRKSIQFLPEVVHEDKETGLLSVSYTELIPVLIEAFKQFLRAYEEDKSSMKMQLDDLKGKLEVLSGKFDKADQDYMPNLNKAISDLKAATRTFVDSSQQYALSLIEREVDMVRKTAFGIVDSVTGSVNAKIQYVRDTVTGVSSKILSVRESVGVPSIVYGQYQYVKDIGLWVFPSFVIARRSAGG